MSRLLQIRKACVFFVGIAFVWLTVLCASGQNLQREWVRTYATELAKTNRAVAIAVAPDGNVVVAGTSQDATGNSDYRVVKYRPDGVAVWSRKLELR